MTKPTDYATLFTVTYLLIYGILTGLKFGPSSFSMFLPILLNKCLYIFSMLMFLKRNLASMPNEFAAHCIKHLKFNDLTDFDDSTLRCSMMGLAENWVKYTQPHIVMGTFISYVIPMCSVLMLDLISTY